MKKINKKTKAEAILQIVILLIGILAISWMVGGEVKIVSAVEGSESPCTTIFCDLSNLYGSKKDASGNCVIDYNNLKQDCPYGCSNGACNQKQNSAGNALKTITSLSATVSSAKGTAAAIKKLSTPIGSAGNKNPPTTPSTATTSAFSTFLFGKDTTPGVSGGWTGVGGESAIGAVGSIVIWSAVAFAVGRYVIGPLFGLSIANSQALGYSLAAGTAAGLLATSTAILGSSAVGGPIGLAIGVVVAFVTFIAIGKKSSADIIQIGCYQWDSQSGRDLTEVQKKQRCELCNNQGDLPCTEYQCRSLGQGCILINEEETGSQLCIWNNTQDIIPPVIIPWEKALLDDFKYTPDNTISPPDKGVKIAYTGTEDVTTDGTTKCSPPYTPISFGVQLNEPAKCKINPLKLSSYAEMADIYMGRGIRAYNQSFALSLPSKEALEAENITVENGGKYELYVRCEDANGNSNIANFVFKFCISQGPDLTAPKILGTSILSGQPIAHGQKSVDIELYVNEPAECKWSHLDKTYDAMEENMACSNSVAEINAQMIYTCSGNLTGLKDNQNNRFYFRCKDQPFLKGTAKESNRNENTQSHVLSIIGTKPLVIESVGPEGVIEDSTEVIKVELTAQTSAGYDEGKAMCYFSETGKPGTYIDFFYGYDTEPFSQYQHKQELWLGQGNYSYYIMCKDKGGNIDNANVSFSVETDISPPIVVRVFKEDEYLKLITDEASECVYSSFGYTYLFDDGNSMITLDDKEHYTDWDINTDLYIKCRDEFGNEPLPNQCSIIARAFEIPELQN